MQTIQVLLNLHACMVYQTNAFEIWFMYKVHHVLFWLLLCWNYSVNMLYKMFWSLKIKKAWHLSCMSRIYIANIHACWNSHISASYSALHMQFILSKEFHCTDVLSTTLFIFILQQVHSETTSMTSARILKEVCSSAFMSYMHT